MDKQAHEKKISLVFDQINANASKTKTDKYVGKFRFEIGKAFRSVDVTDPETYLQTALEAEAYIRTFQVEEEDGIYWSGYLGEKAALSYGLGAAGIAYFYLELYQTTGEPRFRDTVLKASNYLCKHWRESFENAKERASAGGHFSSTSDITGIAKVLFPIYETFHREQEKSTLIAMTDTIVAEAKEDERGIIWDGDPTFGHDAGVVVYLFFASRILHRPDYKVIAEKAADVVLAAGVPDERGGIAWDTNANLFPCRLPNFEMGTAGTGYALAAAYEYTKDERFLEGAKEAAKHLKTIAVPKGKGFLIPFRDEPDTEQIFYVAECHGPTGTSKLFYQLYKVTKDEAYLQDLRGLLEGLHGIGAPERQSAGYWNTVCTCCGTGGILQFALNLYLVSHDQNALDTAKTAANILIAEQEKQEQGTAWPHAWTRITPEFITVDPGFVNGASGIGTALLQIYQLLNHRFHMDRMLEDPFPTRDVQ